MIDEILLIVVIALLLIGAYGLVKTYSEINKSCKTWRVIARGRIISKSRFYPSFGYTVVVGMLLVFKFAFGFRFNLFDLVFFSAIIVLGAIHTYNYSYSAIAKEGLIIGRWFKICVPWEKLGKVVIEGNLVRTKRHVLRIDEGLERLGRELKL